MASEADKILEKLMPIMDRAAVGDFSQDIEFEPDDPYNELYAGVQAMLETIRDQLSTLEIANERLVKYLHSQHGIRLPQPPVKQRGNQRH